MFAVCVSTQVFGDSHGYIFKSTFGTVAGCMIIWITHTPPHNM